MFAIIRKVKEPFGKVGGTIAKETALAFGASQVTAAKCEKIGACAGRVGAGAMLPGFLDPVGTLEELADFGETILDL